MRSVATLRANLADIAATFAFRAPASDDGWATLAAFTVAARAMLEAEGCARLEIVHDAMAACPLWSTTATSPSRPRGVTLASLMTDLDLHADAVGSRESAGRRAVFMMEGQAWYSQPMAWTMVQPACPRTRAGTPIGNEWGRPDAHLRLLGAGGSCRPRERSWQQGVDRSGAACR